MEGRWPSPYLRQNFLLSTEDLEMSAHGASSTTRHSFQAPDLSRRQASQYTQQSFSKVTEFIYVLKKQPKQSDSPSPKAARLALPLTAFRVDCS